MPDSAPPPPLELTISWGTIIKVLSGCLLAWALIKLAPMAGLLALSLLIAITLWPLLQWACRRGLPRWAGILLCALLLFGSVTVVLVLFVPTALNQTQALITGLPQFKTKLLEQLPDSGALRNSANQLLSSPAFTDPQPLLKDFVAWGTVAIEGVFDFFAMLIFALYFLADGERVYEWLLALLPKVDRRKMAEAAPEIAGVVSHYVRGQAICSTLAGVYAFILLSVLKVPDAALMALLAAVLDVIPFVGVFLFAALAALAGLSVSGTTGALAAGLYVCYHLLEAYVIVPHVYGNTLRLSTLTVLISCLAAWLLVGVVGVILALPLVAMYPIVERLWLQRNLQRDTVEKHEELDEKAAAG
jgi:predicted PurR-regulated permease PerM